MSDLAMPATQATAAGPRRGRGAEFAVMVGRCVRLSRRNVDALLTALMLPVFLMLIFVYLFGGAISSREAYVTYVVPGVLLLCTGYGAATTAVAVSSDLTEGIVERFRSMDVSAGAILGGHVAASVARNTVATLLVLAVAVAIGFRPAASPTQAVGAAAVLLLFVLAISWFSAAVGLLASGPEAASGFTFAVMFLPYASSAFVPVETMPGWIQGFARNQPVTPVIETLRGLLLDGPVGNAAALAVAWCLALLAVSVLASVLLFRRRVA